MLVMTCISTCQNCKSDLCKRKQKTTNMKTLNASTPIENVMQRCIVHLHPGESIHKAEEIFRQYDIHHIPIVKLEKIVGIVSLGDVLYTRGQDYAQFTKMRQVLNMRVMNDQLTVGEIMTEHPISMKAHDSVTVAIELMLKHRINCIPVVDEHEKLLGLVTTYDILTFIHHSI